MSGEGINANLADVIDVGTVTGDRLLLGSCAVECIPSKSGVAGRCAGAPATRRDWPRPKAGGYAAGLASRCTQRLRTKIRAKLAWWQDPINH